MTTTTLTTTMTVTRMTANNGLLRLMQAFDSLFPIGSFTMSNGMETYVQRGIVKDKDSLSRFLTAYLYTLPTADLGFAAHAAEGGEICELDSLFTAARSPIELREGSAKVCRRFLKTELSIAEYPLLREYLDGITAGEYYGSQPIAVGLFIRDIGEDLRQGLSMYAYSLLSTMVNHAVKLVPLRQHEGQCALSAAIDGVEGAVARAMETEIYDLGISGGGFDLRSMQHERLYTRIYIS